MSSYFDALNRRLAAPPAAQPPLREDPSRGEPPPADAPPRAHPLVIPRASGQPPTSPVLPEPYERLRERLLVAANGRALKTMRS